MNDSPREIDLTPNSKEVNGLDDINCFVQKHVRLQSDEPDIHVGLSLKGFNGKQKKVSCWMQTQFCQDCKRDYLTRVEREVLG